MNSFPRSLGRSSHAPALLVAVVGAVVHLLWRPPSNDLAVQEFRVELFRRAPFAIWNNQWFAGHHTPSYSLLSPLLGSIVGVRMLGVIGVVAAAWAGSVLVHRVAARTPGLHRSVGTSVLFACGCLVSLYGGRLTFLMGVAVGVTALLAALQRPVWWTVALSAMTAAASPVAGAFVAVIGCAVWCSAALPRRQGAALVVGAMSVVLTVAVLFPEGGTFPFPFGGLVNVLLVTAAVAFIGWRYVFLRWMCLGYAGFCLLSALPVTPIGGNAARLAALAAPVVVVAAAQFRAPLVAALVVPLVVLQWAPVSLIFRTGLAQAEAEFYAPLLDELSRVEGPLRVEVVPVKTHMEAYTVALEVPIARGWNRQIDREMNALFFDDREDAALDPQDYLDWLNENGVGMVAIADTELDEGGLLERELLESPPDYLRLVHEDPVWRVFAVVPESELVVGDGEMTDIGIDDFELSATAPGTLLVRVRFSPWWQVTSGDACVTEGNDGWTEVRVRSAGSVRVAATLSLPAVWNRDGDC
jgi:hypothetical protein